MKTNIFNISYVILVHLWLFTDRYGQPVSSIFKGEAVQEDTP